MQQRPLDERIAETQMPAAQVNSILLMLEMKGLVKRLPGGSFIRAVYF
ncbi:MAG: hypothetical protein ACUVRO_15430 [Armatimonadota bacterium]